MLHPRRSLRYRAKLEVLEDRITPALTDGLSALWAFDGDGLDSTNNARHLNLVGNPDFDEGRFGQALSLGGNDSQFARRPGDDSEFDFGSGDFTIQAWVHLHSLTGEQTIIEKFRDSTDSGWNLTKAANNDLVFDVGPDLSSVVSDTSLVANTWQHVLVRRHGDTFEMFINGASVGTLTDNDSVGNHSNSLFIGRSDDGNSAPLDGLIDETAIWNRALSDAEVAALAGGESLLPSFQGTLQFETFASGFSAPVVATHAGDGSGRLFVVEQTGRIRIVENGAILNTPFLNLSSDIVTGGERGLLGLAFHPDYASSGADGEGKFYVYYSAEETFGGNHDSVVSEFQVSAGDPNVADPNSERELLRFNQPFPGHNAGDLHFGPDDGLLYVASGDGGDANDPFNNAQDPSNLLGNILRIDVDGDNGPGGQYGIPASNPFVGQEGFRDEIFAYGLRNPYRMSFDDGPNGATSTDRLFVGDVGQGAFEEINLVTSGGNYGWRIREGAHPHINDPDPGNLIDPIAEYPNVQRGTAVIGGYVYRGSLLPQLEGLYIFADFGGQVYALEEGGGQFKLFEPNVDGGNPFSQNIIAFGEDEDGELYVMTFSQVLRIGLASDYGDAPDDEAASPSYATLAANNGPSHGLSDAIFMGATVDAESDGIPNANADGDDSDGNSDEDGIADPASQLTVAVGAQPEIDVTVTNTSGAAATLFGWIDYNNDGVFDNATERAQVAVPDGTINGVVTLDFPTVPGSFTGTTYARFRLSTDTAASDPTGAAGDGEVEDYTATIFEPGTIGDFVWHDLNGDGDQDGGELGVPETEVELFLSTDTVIGDADDRSLGFQTTTGNGQYEFTGLAPGNYYVEFRPPDGFEFTTPNLGDDNFDSDANPANGQTGLIVLAEGADNDTIDAGLSEIPIEVDLFVTKSDGGVSVRPGEIVTYNITYGNRGGATAENVVLTETLPADSTFVAAQSTPGWTETTPGQFTLDLPDLPHNGGGVVSFAVRAHDPFPVGPVHIHNVTSISYDEAHGTDANLNDNQATDTTPILRTRQLIVVGADAGGSPHVKAFDAQTGEPKWSFFAYDAAFVGGVRVATGDINGDGVVDIVTAPGAGGGPHIKVFDGADGSLLRSYFAYDPTFSNGVYVAAGDVNGDGAADIITGAGAGGGPHVRVFDGVTSQIIRDFYAYSPFFDGGVRVAAGDIDGDRRSDIFTGAGTGGGPHVRVFDGDNTALLQEFFAFAPTYTGGVFVASGDVNGDGRDEVLVSGHVSLPVKIFNGAAATELGAFIPFTAAPIVPNPAAIADPSSHGNIRVATVDVTGDGRDEILTAIGGGYAPDVRVFDGLSFQELDQFFAFDPAFVGGVFVGDNG